MTHYYETHILKILISFFKWAISAYLINFDLIENNKVRYFNTIQNNDVALNIQDYHDMICIIIIWHSMTFHLNLYGDCTPDLDIVWYLLVDHMSFCNTLFLGKTSHWIIKVEDLNDIKPRLFKFIEWFTSSDAPTAFTKHVSFVSMNHYRTLLFYYAVFI